MFPNSRNPVPRMSVAKATEYVRTMVHRESRGPGDIENALRRLEAKYGLPFWSIWHLRKGKAKTVEASLLARIEGAYLDMCKRQATSLLSEIEESGDDVLDQDLVDRLRAILAEMEARQARG